MRISRETQAAVSVIIPAYRASREIPDALESVFAQSFSDVEVIIVDDGSPDHDELVAAIEPYRSRIRYIEQANAGAGAARNAAIRVAQGRYLAFLDADDRWEPDFLRRQVWYLDAHPETALVYGDALLSGQTPFAGQRYMQAAPSNGEVTLLSLIEQRCNIILSTVVARTEAIVAVGLFNEGLRRGQDFELWLRLAHAGARIEYQTHVLAERRVHAAGLSGDAIAEIQRAINVLAQFGRSRELPPAARTALRIRTMTLVDRLEIERGKQRFLEGNFAAAQYHFEAARARTWKIRAAAVAMRIAPRLVRAVYVRVRPSAWRVPPATAAHAG
jgi:glycosyltransferase involved in cell wall biosynthesis